MMSSLLPEDGPDAIRRLGHAVIDRMAAAYASSLEQRAPLFEVAPELEERLAAVPPSLPRKGTNADDLLAEVQGLLDSGGCNVLNPRYFGYITPRPAPIGVLGDMLAAIGNQTPGAWRAGPVATVVEREVLSWVAGIVGYAPQGPFAAAGIFTSGGTEANLSALKLARDRVSGADGQGRGLYGGRPLTVYMSASGHFSVARAMDVLGLGRDMLRLVQPGPDGRVVPNDLHRAMDADRRQGFRPACIVGVAGTTALGAVDPLAELAALAAETGVWFHVDAAAGGPFATHPAASDAFDGIALADSVTVDPCKLLFTGFGLGCLLVRDTAALGRSFHVAGPYWQDDGKQDNFQISLRGTRDWRSLGLWMVLRRYGRDGVAGLLSRLLDGASALRGAIAGSSGLELLPCGPLPVVCFRPRVPRDRLAEVVRTLRQAAETAVVAYITELDYPDGAPCLRMAVSNYAFDASVAPQVVEALAALAEAA